MSLSPYGNERNVSPRLAAFAEDALLFEEARSASVFTFSSHLTMLTGAYPSQHGGRLVRMRFDTERATSVARRLREAGYRTGAFVGTSVLAAHTGVDDGFDVYDDLVDPPVCDTHAWALVHDVQSVLASLFPALRGHGRPHWFQDFQRPADDVLARAAEWIEGGDERPWFCFVNLYDVHWPYLPDHAGRENWVGPYDGPMDGFAARANHLWGTDYAPDGDDARHLTELYEAEIWELDGKVADFLDGLDPRTDAVLLTADHGEAFGEAGVWEHDDLYEPQVHVPFVVRVAGEDRPRGQVPGAVAGIDVAPTLLGLAGVAPPGGLPGLDLTQDRPEPDRAILVEDRDLLDPRASRSAVYRGGWKLEERILGGERVLRLYDLASDPVGERDLAAAHPERVEALAAQLAELRADFAASEDGGEEHSSEDALRALGYLDGS